MEVEKSVAILGTRGYPSYYGGFETLVRQLAPYLAASGWRVDVYGRGPRTGAPHASGDADVRSIGTWGVDSRSLSTLSYGLSAAVDSCIRRPDITLIMNVANGFWLPLLRSRGIPTVVNVDGIEWERDKWGKVAKATFAAGARLTARHADALIFDSMAIAERWRDDFARTGTFIPYGGHPYQVRTAPLNLPSRGYALFVARFVPENTVAEFFAAARRISARRPVVIVGSTGYGGAFDDEARELSTRVNITWLGHLSDDTMLHSLWHHAGAYFHGHSVGGTNPALVQAMACGAPTVARDTVYNREVLADSGVFVKPNSDAIAASMIGLLTDPEMQANLSRDASRRAWSGYSWQSVCSQYDDLLNAELDRNPSNSSAAGRDGSRPKR